ncbi:MAG: S1C family serine protease [Planctomycetota bacterium]
MNTRFVNLWNRFVVYSVLVLVLMLGLAPEKAWSQDLGAIQSVPSLQDLAREAQSKVVKIYGAGGIRGLEAYQSGFLVSPEGHIATAWSYVLDVDPIVQLDDGSRFDAKVLQFEPSLELALLKIDISEADFFKISPDLECRWGDPVMAISNLFNIATGNEPASVMQGSIASIGPLDARRGTFETPYRGEVLLLDLIANNPGAAGGALVDTRGRLVGMLGKELRDSRTGVWLNYAIPATVLRQAIGDMVAGRRLPPPIEATPVLPRQDSHNLRRLGLIMIPDVLENTPAFVDRVKTDSSAGRALVLPDDLILLVGNHRIDSQQTLVDRLRRIDRRDDVPLTLQRGNAIITVTLEPMQ